MTPRSLSKFSSSQLRSTVFPVSRNRSSSRSKKKDFLPRQGFQFLRRGVTGQQADGLPSLRQLVGHVAFLQAVDFPVEFRPHGSVRQPLHGLVFLEPVVEGAHHVDPVSRKPVHLARFQPGAVLEGDDHVPDQPPRVLRQPARPEQLHQRTDDRALAAAVQPGEDVHVGPQAPLQVEPPPQPQDFDVGDVIVRFHSVFRFVAFSSPKGSEIKSGLLNLGRNYFV